MKLQNIKFDKKTDYFFVEGVDYSEAERVLGPRTYNSKIFKISDGVFILFNYWLLTHTLSLIIFIRDNKNGAISDEGESLFLQFNNMKEMQDFIKANYEVIQ